MRAALPAACLLALWACGGTSAPGPADAAAAAPGAPDAGVSAPPGSSDAGVSSPDAGVSAPPDAGPPAPQLAGCPMFPADNDWNRDVSADPVDAHSADFLAFMGAVQLQPDFGGPYGQPIAVVSGQPGVPMTFRYASQSEPGPYPFPPDVPIQQNEDKHAAVLDRDHCLLYETYFTQRSGDGFSADSGALFNLISGAPRPAGWTSATASGLPILPGLARADEALDLGEIRHALGFVAGATAHAWVAPATHSSGSSDASYAPPMGLRVRLRANFDLSGFHGASLVILSALQRYGMLLKDSGSGQYWAVAGTQDPRWPVQDLEQLKTVPASAFEVLKLPQVQPGL